MRFFSSLRRSQRGFTLIEALIVLFIVGFLSTIAFVSFRKSRSDSRDIRRTTDLTTVQEAVELYYDDKGYFPSCTGSVATYCHYTPANLNGYNLGNVCICTNSATKTSYHGDFGDIRDIASRYIAALPKDPLDNTTYFYAYLRGYKKVSDTVVTQTGLSSDYILATNREGISCSTSPCAVVDALAGSSWTFNTVIGN